MTAAAPNDSFHVRPAVRGDLPAVVDLLEAVVAEGRWLGSEVIDRQERLAYFRSVIDSHDDALFVAEAGGDPIGHLAIGLRPYGVAELGMLVAAGWRGRGVGSALLDAAVAWARGAGAHKVALQLWPHNEAARNLYRRFGFVEEGRLRRHYRRRSGELWDALVMGLLLEEKGPAV